MRDRLVADALVHVVVNVFPLWLRLFVGRRIRGRSSFLIGCKIGNAERDENERSNQQCSDRPHIWRSSQRKNGGRVSEATWQNKRERLLLFLGEQRVIVANGRSVNVVRHLKIVF